MNIICVISIINNNAMSTIGTKSNHFMNNINEIDDGSDFEENRDNVEYYQKMNYQLKQIVIIYLDNVDQCN